MYTEQAKPRISLQERDIGKALKNLCRGAMASDLNVNNWPVAGIHAV